MTILTQFYFKTILIFTIILQFSRLTVSTSVPEDWPHISILESSRYNIAINAFINLTQLVEENKWVQIGEVEEFGRFGTGYVGPTSGQLVHIKSTEDDNDHTACTLPLLNSNGFYGAFPNKPWIALISRGGCNFDKKIVNAYELGARGVIIYNNVEKEVLEVMSLSHNTGKNKTTTPHTTICSVRIKYGQEQSEVTRREPRERSQLNGVTTPVACETVSV